MKEFYQRYKYILRSAFLLLFLSFFGCLMVIIRWASIGTPKYLFLIWNLFLSWIPLGISIIMSYIHTKAINKIRRVQLLSLGVIWLLFYPNAPYMLTDYIHLKNSHSLLTWFDLAMYSTFILTSLLVGFISLYLINRIVLKLTNKIIGWSFVVCVLFLSSYGIYLGRFIRWNSWDIILNPLNLFISFFENINFDSLVFSLMYGILLTLIYAFLIGLTYLKLDKTY